MSWQTTMVQIVRHLINDVDSATYTDARLEETILVAAQLQYVSIDFDNAYSIDVDSVTLSPDPTVVADDIFINLVCMRAACIVLGSEAKTMAAQSYKVKDGPSTIETGEAYTNTYGMYKDMQNALARAIMQYKAGDSVGAQAILTPYTQDILSGNPIRNFQ